MANEKLSALVERNIEQITQTWMQSVRNDARIDSDATLTHSELRDHVPAIMEEICELLRANETPTPTNTLEGRVKVYLRFQQGYRGRELAREVSLLRTVMLDFLTDRCSSPLMNASLRGYYPTIRIINLYLDEVMINAISAYSETV
ncbi:MAG: RsbRD N-terminal domain-containing protein [Candidatus Manganitrophus sp.]|nr:RsbRD N-terminal domain-containing protein [Candidatus Manganitrophus sp.]